MVFCLAGRHALRLRGELGELEEQAHQAIRATVGDDPACEGCQLRASIPSKWNDDNPVPPPCRPWVVAYQDNGRWDGLIMPPLRLLILSDMGDSLQKYLETRLTRHRSRSRRTLYRASSRRSTNWPRPWRRSTTRAGSIWT